MFDAFIYLILLSLAFWFWLDSARSREIATGTCKTICRRDQLQFLDDTVSLTALSLARDPRGTVRIRRSYRFEYATSGERRYEGLLVMLGDQVQVLNMDRPEDEVE